MSDLLKPIYDHAHPERLTRMEVKAIEDMALTWGEVMVIREQRLLAQIEGLAHDNECLAEQIEDLETMNATLQRQNARLAEARNDAERLVSRLAIVTLVLGMIVAALVVTR